MVQSWEKEYGSSSHNQMELFDPAILLLSICTKEWEAGTQTDICMHQ